MAGYSSFSLKSVKTKFGLKTKKQILFPNHLLIPPSDWLVSTLERSDLFTTNSEKSRSEWLVSPILFELKANNKDKLAILSGENLDIDKDLGLTGECDFIFLNNPDAVIVESPIFCMIEAERNDISGGMGQCVGQMIGARMLNEQDDIHFTAIYGCVTTGQEWQFLKLNDNTVTIHPKLYFFNDIPRLLGIFQAIIDEF